MTSKHDHIGFIGGIEPCIASIAVQLLAVFIVPKQLTPAKRQYLQAPGNGMSHRLQSSPSAEASELPETQGSTDILTTKSEGLTTARIGVLELNQ